MKDGKEGEKHFQFSGSRKKKKEYHPKYLVRWKKKRAIHRFYEGRAD